MESGSARAIIAAFAANLGIAVAKFIAFAFTGAASMLAEAIHSVADTSNQALLMLGGRLARKKADKEHQFGFGRERYFWSFIVALVIFTLGAAFAIYEGLSKIVHPHPLESPSWAVATLLVAIVLESYSLLTAVGEARKVIGGQSWWSFIRSAKVPELPVVLLEDVGALVGLALALAGIGLAMVTGDARFDAVGSIAIGILLGVIAIILVIEMKSLIIGESASPENDAAVTAAVMKCHWVKRIIHMKTQHMGPEHLLVCMKLEFDRALTVEGLAAAIDEVESSIRITVPIARTIFVEPDLFRVK